MERADDIDRYFKKNLEGETHVPSAYARIELFEKLEQQQKADNRHARYKRLVLFVVVLLFGSQFTNDTNLTSLTTTVDIQKERVLLAEIKPQNIDKEAHNVMSTIEINSREPEKYHQAHLEKRERNDEAKSLNAVHEDISSLDDKWIDYSTPHGVEITHSAANFQRVAESEIDSLMQLAAYTLRQEEASFAARRAFAIKMLSEIENESQLKPKKGFAENLKQGFKKFKDVIAN